MHIFYISIPALSGLRPGSLNLSHSATTIATSPSATISIKYNIHEYGSQ